MFLMFVTFVVTLAGLGVLAWLGFRRIALHLRGNPEATKAVVEHVLIPLFGRPTTCEIEFLPDGTMVEDNEPAKKEKKWF